MFIRTGILVCVVTVLGMRVLFFRERFLSLTEMWGFGVMGGGVFDLGGDFAVVVEVEAKALELVVKVVVRLVWGCFSGRMSFLWRFNLMLVEGKISTVGGLSSVMLRYSDTGRFF